MTRDMVDDAERAEFYEADLPPETWLTATEVVNSEHEGIAALGQEIGDDSSSPLEQMLGVIEWTSANITYPTDWSGVSGLDATSAFESGEGSCTAFANLAAALGRAGNLPSRVLANYYVGMAQQTHYIDEFYLGEELGWRRVEPQGTAATVKEDYVLAMRIVHPDDEGEEAFSPYAWAFSGVPWKTLTTALAGYERFTPNFAYEYFPGHPGCDNQAAKTAWLVGPSSTFEQIFEDARASWQEDLEALLSDGEIGEERMAIRRQAAEAVDLDDVAEMISQLGEL